MSKIQDTFRNKRTVVVLVCGVCRDWSLHIFWFLFHNQCTSLGKHIITVWQRECCSRNSDLKEKKKKKKTT